MLSTEKQYIDHSRLSTETYYSMLLVLPKQSTSLSPVTLFVRYEGHTTLFYLGHQANMDFSNQAFLVFPCFYNPQASQVRPGHCRLQPKLSSAVIICT